MLATRQKILSECDVTLERYHNSLIKGEYGQGRWFVVCCHTRTIKLAMGGTKEWRRLFTPLLVWYCSKITSHSLASFSRVNWPTRGEQRVEEMASQANTRLEPLAKSNFLHTVVSSRCCKSCCEYSSENSILYYPIFRRECCKGFI